MKLSQENILLNRRKLQGQNTTPTWTIIHGILSHVQKEKNIVGSRWVFKVKRDASGSTQKYKARLVAKGYSYLEGIDYQEVFSPVARYDSIKSLLAVKCVRLGHSSNGC